MIEHYEFGKYRINGKEYRYDIKIVGEDVRVWENREDHVLRIVDIIDLIKEEPEILIIGTGFSGFLEVSNDVKDFVRDKGVELVIKKTKEACEIYNKLVKKRKIVGIFHGTC